MCVEFSSFPTSEHVLEDFLLTGLKLITLAGALSLLLELEEPLPFPCLRIFLLALTEPDEAESRAIFFSALLATAATAISVTR